MLFHYSDLWSSNGSFIILCVAVCVSLFFHRRKQLPIPVVGVSTALDGFGLRVLGVVANIFNTRDLLEKGYKKVSPCRTFINIDLTQRKQYGLQNKAFYIPQLEADNILIPPAWFKAYKRAPATDLSLDGAIEAVSKPCSYEFRTADFSYVESSSLILAGSANTGKLLPH